MLESLVENPVLIKEIKTKMRSKQPPRVQAAVAALFALFILYCYYEAITWLLRVGGANSGDDGWGVAVGAQAILIWLLSPALTANALSQEKEQQTWEMMIFTLLSARDILLGKFAARLLPMFALLAAFAPFVLICCWMSAKLTLADLLLTYGVFTIWIVFLATCGLFMSWAFRKTSAALAMSYLVAFALTIGTVLVNMTLSMNQSWAESWVWWLNPIRITAALINRSGDGDASGVLILSSVTYVLAGALLFWRMLSRFRELSVE